MIDNEATACVHTFIAGVNSRNADLAQQVVAPNVEMLFPGGVMMNSLQEFFVWLQGRTPKSHYEYDTIHLVPLEGGATVAYASGRISGTTTNGTEFSGVRVIDKFTVAGGKIVKKEAWSDMGQILSRPAS